MDTLTVVEEGSQYDIPRSVGLQLEADSVIYKCEECGSEIYHVEPDPQWERFLDSLAKLSP